METYRKKNRTILAHKLTFDDEDKEWLWAHMEHARFKIFHPFGNRWPTVRINKKDVSYGDYIIFDYDRDGWSGILQEDFENKWTQIT